jgi:hypothetical protein
MVGCATGRVGDQHTRPGLTITPQIGAYRPGDKAIEVAEGAIQGDLEKNHALALGVTAESGIFRGTLMYATNAEISAEGGIGDSEDIGEGRMLGVAGDLVFRPFGGLPIQPYVLGGLGWKNFEYSFEDDNLEDLIESESFFSLHYGAGIEAMLGRVGIMLELTDFLSLEDKEFGRNDSFLMTGLRIRL